MAKRKLNDGIQHGGPLVDVPFDRAGAQQRAAADGVAALCHDALAGRDAAHQGARSLAGLDSHLPPVEALPAELDVHLVLDNASTHKTPAIRRWLAAHPRFVLHFTPTSASWLNLVERWFAELTTKKLQRSAHRSVRALNADVRGWIDTWNDNPEPYVWVKTAEEIPDSVASNCKRITDSGH